MGVLKTVGAFHCQTSWAASRAAEIGVKDLAVGVSVGAVSRCPFPFVASQMLHVSPFLWAVDAPLVQSTDRPVGPRSVLQRPESKIALVWALLSRLPTCSLVLRTGEGPLVLLIGRTS